MFPSGELPVRLICWPYFCRWKIACLGLLVTNCLTFQFPVVRLPMTYIYWWWIWSLSFFILFREIQKRMAAKLACKYEFFHIFISWGIWNCDQTDPLGLLNIGAFWFLWIITDIKNQCITNWHTLTFVNMTHCPKEVLLKQVIIGFKNATSLEIGFFLVTLTLACLCIWET